ncbi:MAG: hypothetical protein JNG88_18450, partial [Phycisphaerales bacterium]|nr:hypothetical protein [Phycisphaerales bacterium]
MKRNPIVVLFILSGSIVGRAGDQWTITDIGTLTPNASLTVPTGMNNHGVVIGAGGESSFVWGCGVMRAVPRPMGTRYTNVRDINDVGQIAGSARLDVDGIVNHAYRWHNDQIEWIGTLGDGRAATAWGINNFGHVVGYSETEDSPFSPAHAFFWNGQLIDVGPATEDPDDSSAAYDVNDTGTIVGSSHFPNRPHPRYTGCVWHDGSPCELLPLPGDLATQGDKINNLGTIAGISAYQRENHAVMWRDGEIIALTPFNPDDPNSFETSEAYDINDFDEVVGAGTTVSFQGHGFLWRNGEIILMESLAPADFEWILGPEAINNAGQLACRGHYRPDPFGVPQRTFILTPPVCRGFPRGDANCDGLVNNFD